MTRAAAMIVVMAAGSRKTYCRTLKWIVPGFVESGEVVVQGLAASHPVIRRALLGGGAVAHLATLRPARPAGAVSTATDRTGEEAR